MASRRPEARSREGSGPSGGGSEVKPQPVLKIRPRWGRQTTLETPACAPRDNRGLSRGERACSTGRFRPAFRLPENRKPFPPKVRPLRRCSGATGRSCNRTLQRGRFTDCESIGVHSNGVHTYPLQWTSSCNGPRHGMHWYAMHWSPLHTNAFHAVPSGRRPGEKDAEARGLFTTILVTSQILRR